jgi:hypothetical protein
MDAYSQPMAPPPITAKLLGSLSRRKMRSESDTRASSNGTDDG